ncbi:MAG: thiamine diphosphokinase [Chloroflexi bacterium]|nr:thiamine diphosphokinase [Chloroflexota bacterium]
MAVLVFANGVIEDVGWIRPYLSAATVIIAADGGTRHLLALNRLPDAVIGDMDSLTDEVRAWLAGTAVQFNPHPAAKDETDLELALLYAVSHYDEEIWLFGALGGRLDQTLANILLLAHPALAKRPITLFSPHERAWLVTDKTEIRGQIGDVVSLIPLGGDAHVRATTGLQWPLRDERLAFGLARGVSNVMVEDAATVWVRDGRSDGRLDGRLLCIHSVKRERSVR